MVHIGYRFAIEGYFGPAVLEGVGAGELRLDDDLAGGVSVADLAVPDDAEKAVGKVVRAVVDPEDLVKALPMRIDGDELIISAGFVDDDAKGGNGVGEAEPVAPEWHHGIALLVDISKVFAHFVGVAGDPEKGIPGRGVRDLSVFGALVFFRLRLGCAGKKSHYGCQGQ